MYYPVEVEGALLSMGDCHGHQGDGETAATGIETSLDGSVRRALPYCTWLHYLLKPLSFFLSSTCNDATLL